MKLLIVFPGALYPLLGMSQVRVVQQIKRLSQDHEIIFTDVVAKDNQKAECKAQLETYLKEYRPVFAGSYKRSRVYRSIRYITLRMAMYLSFLCFEEIFLSYGPIKKQMVHLVKETEFDAILIHYWYMGYIFDKLPVRTCKLIDTHYLVQENQELLPRYQLTPLMRWRMQHELQHSLMLQNKYFNQSDLIIVNSAKQRLMLSKESPGLKVEVVVNGQDIAVMLSYNTPIETHSILFYGALSNQFNRSALKTLLSDIYPLLLKEIPDSKLYIVGSNPPFDLLNQYPRENVVITGFVEDIKPYVARCCLMILPLETGSGFRGRAVEVMALGVPIIGTYNALQSVGITDGREGFITDKTEELVQRALEIIKTPGLREEMSIACRKYAEEHFSPDATFGKLSTTLTRMKQETSKKG
jgi:polysaccharide biosynthesis protein PslH